MSLLILLHYPEIIAYLETLSLISEKWKKSSLTCRKIVIPYHYTMRRTIAYAYTLQNDIAYLNLCITYLNTLSRLAILILALPILSHWLGFWLSAPYLNTCLAYPNILTRLPIIIHALPIFLQPLYILIPWFGFRLLAPYLNTCIAYLNTLIRLSAPCLNTCTA